MSAGFFARAVLSSDSGRYVTFSFLPIFSSYSVKIWLKDCHRDNSAISCKSHAADIAYLAFGLDAEDLPFNFRPWQVREHVCNKSADVRLCCERIQRITVQASYNVAALEIQTNHTISAS